MNSRTLPVPRGIHGFSRYSCRAHRLNPRTYTACAGTGGDQAGEERPYEESEVLQDRPRHHPKSALPFSPMNLNGAPAWGASFRSAKDSAALAENVDYCWRFFVGEAEAQKAARKLVAILEAEGTPYAIIGALAMNEYGHRRVTVDVDLVMREDDLQGFKRRWLGKGYSERVVGTGKLLDTDFDVHIDVLSTGRFPGDDKPKPIAFPDPTTMAIRGAPFAMLPVARWIELKLASGMVAKHRLKDLADVQELIRSGRLPPEVADDLHPWVRGKFDELRQAVEEAKASDPY